MGVKKPRAGLPNPFALLAGAAAQLLRPLWKLAHRRVLRRSPEIEGIRVIPLCNPTEAAGLKVAESLRILATAAPSEFRRVRIQLGSIDVAPRYLRLPYVVDTATSCLFVSPRLLARISRDDLAIAISAASVRMRLERAGIDAHSPDRKSVV